MQAVLKQNSPSSIDPVEFEFFRDLINEIAGISLSSSKIDLVSTRLRHRLPALGLASFHDYKLYLQKLPANHEERQTFINLLTTNKTDFFREPRHFDYLTEKYIPEWLKTNKETLKIWCAASSTGEEPYTLAMVLNQVLPKDRNFRILATDIDTQVLNVGQNAVYPISKLSEIPQDYHRGALTRGTGGIQNWFRIQPHLKDAVVFKKHNLIEKSYPGDEVFDLVFCRNVLIYFAKETIEFVVNKLLLSTKPEGQLFIGHSESLQGIKTEWKSDQPAIYRKPKR